MRNRTTLAGAALAAALAVAGCGSSSSGTGAAAASSAYSSLTANPQFQQAEQELLANLKKDFTASHPYASAKQAVEDTFPGGNSKKIANYAVRTFTLKAAHKGAARTAWVQGVVTYALQQGAQGTGTGQPSIPGVTSTATSS